MRGLVRQKGKVGPITERQDTHIAKKKHNANAMVFRLKKRRESKVVDHIYSKLCFPQLVFSARCLLREHYHLGV